MHVCIQSRFKSQIMTYDDAGGTTTSTANANSQSNSQAATAVSQATAKAVAAVSRSPRFLLLNLSAESFIKHFYSMSIQGSRGFCIIQNFTRFSSDAEKASGNSEALPPAMFSWLDLAQVQGGGDATAQAQALATAIAQVINQVLGTSWAMAATQVCSSSFAWQNKSWPLICTAV